MVVENTNTAFKIWLRNLISTIVLATCLIVLYMTTLLEEPVVGIGRIHVTIFLSVIYLYLVLFPWILKYQFIYISDEDQKLIIKYYTIGFLPGTRKTIEFPIREFSKFEINRSFFNLRESVVIYRKIKKGIAKYPPIYFSGLNPRQRERAITLFKRLISS